MVKRTHTMKSSQLPGMMTGPGAADEGEVNEINPTDIVVREYLEYKANTPGLIMNFLLFLIYKLIKVTPWCGLLRITVTWNIHVNVSQWQSQVSFQNLIIITVLDKSDVTNLSNQLSIEIIDSFNQCDLLPLRYEFRRQLPEVNIAHDRRRLQKQTMLKLSIILTLTVIILQLFCYLQMT